MKKTTSKSHAKSLITTLPLIMVLSSCMTMNKRECQNGEWRTAGFEDASRGRTNSRFNAHAKACAKHGINADKALYDTGYNEGLQTYCSQANGIQVGRKANDYNGICPAESEQGFLRGYVHGLELALDELERKYDDARDDLSNARYRRLRVDSDKDKSHIDNEIDDLLKDIRELNNKRSDVSSTIAQWLHRL